MELLAPLPAGILRGLWPGGTLHARGNADTPGGGHPGTPAGLVVVFLPPKSSGLLDGSQGAKQSAVSAESSQVAQPAWFLNGKPGQMSKNWLWRGVYDQLLYSWWFCNPRGIVWPFHIASLS